MRTVSILFLIICCLQNGLTQIDMEILNRSERRSHFLKKKLNLNEEDRCNVQMIISDTMFELYKKNPEITDLEAFYATLKNITFKKMKAYFPVAMHKRIDEVEREFAIQAQKRAERIKKQMKRKANS